MSSAHLSDDAAAASGVTPRRVDAGDSAPWWSRWQIQVARYFAKPVVAMRATVDSAVAGIS
jgi:hypothetical protein